MSAIDWHGARRQRCPACGRSDRDKTLGVTVDQGRGVAHCFRCGHIETIRGERRAGVAPMRSTPKHETLSDFGAELWSACRPVGGEARAYLQARGCVIPPRDGDLRWHPALRHPPSGTAGPALVGLVTHAVTRTALSLHRTWVRADGSKAPVDPPRMLLGGHAKAGGVVRLWPDEAVTTGLAVGEGAETCLSIACAFEPVWSLIDAGGLASFPVLRGVESLLVAADNDASGTGQRAAHACAQRWAAEGREVHVVMSPHTQTDLNDVRLAA